MVSLSFIEPMPGSSYMQNKGFKVAARVALAVSAWTSSFSLAHRHSPLLAASCHPCSEKTCL